MSDDRLREILLLKEFDQRFQEKVVHMQHYHRQTDLLHLYTTLLLGLGAALLAPQTQAFLKSHNLFSTTMSHALSFCILIFVILVAEYLLFNILSSWVIIFRNALRLSELEIELNELCGYSALKWDSKIAPEFYHLSSRCFILMRFDVLSTVIIIAILSLAAAVIAFITHSIIPEYFRLIIGVLSIFGIINGYQFLRLSTNFLKEIHTFTTTLSTSGRIRA